MSSTSNAYQEVEQLPNLCHVEIVINIKGREKYIDNLMWLQPEPNNEHDHRAMAVYTASGCVGYVTNMFVELSHEEYLNGSELIPLYLYAGSKSMCLCALQRR